MLSPFLRRLLFYYILNCYNCTLENCKAVILMYFINLIFRPLNSRMKFAQIIRRKQTKSTIATINSLVKPATIKDNLKKSNVGFELAGTLNKRQLIQVLYKFSVNNAVKKICEQNGIDGNFYYLYILNQKI